MADSDHNIVYMKVCLWSLGIQPTSTQIAKPPDVQSAGDHVRRDVPREDSREGRFHSPGKFPATQYCWFSCTIHHNHHRCGTSRSATNTTPTPPAWKLRVCRKFGYSPNSMDRERCATTLARPPPGSNRFEDSEDGVCESTGDRCRSTYLFRNVAEGERLLADDQRGPYKHLQSTVGLEWKYENGKRTVDWGRGRHATE